MTGISVAKTKSVEDELATVRLGCAVESLQYDYRTRVGTLHLAVNDVSDLHDQNAYINLFQGIDANVREIRCYAAKVLGVVHLRCGEKNWNSYEV